MYRGLEGWIRHVHVRKVNRTNIVGRSHKVQMLRKFALFFHMFKTDRKNVIVDFLVSYRSQFILFACKLK